MKRTTLILLALFIGGCLLKAQNHSGFKLSATFNNTHLSPDGDQEYASYSEGSGWEFGYSFHIPVWHRLSFQIEPALGQLPFDYKNAESDVYWNEPDPSTTTLSANLLANVHILKGWSVQAGPRFDYRILGDRNKDFNMELTAGLLKHFKWLDVYARYHHGIRNVYGIETYYYGSSDPAYTTIPGPQSSFQDTEGYTRRFEIGIVLPVFKLFGNK